MTALPDTDVPTQTDVRAPQRESRWLSPLNERRLRNFRKNRRAVWSLRIFLVLFFMSLFAEFLANDKPIMVNYRGELRMPIFTYYSEEDFGGDLNARAEYRFEEIECLIVTGGYQECYYEPDALIAAVEAGEQIDYDDFVEGWTLWPPIRNSFESSSMQPGQAPLAPNEENWFGTDTSKRDVVARIIYGFRIAIMYAAIVVTCASIIGVIAGAVQGFFGGTTDLVFQRVIEIWRGVPEIYIIIIMFAIYGRSLTLLIILSILFGWPALVDVVRAEFLRARNFEYVRAARALGVSNWTIMFRHMLPNAMVATLTLLPFMVTGTISALAGLDFLGYGLPPGSPSLGELARQAKDLPTSAPWLGYSAFATFAILLSLLVFIFEGVRDAFDPRKTFS